MSYSYNPCLKTGALAWIDSYGLAFTCDAFVLDSQLSAAISNPADYYERCRQTLGRHHLLLRGPTSQLSSHHPFGQLVSPISLYHIIVERTALIWRDADQSIFLIAPGDWHWLAYEGRTAAELEPSLRAFLPTSDNRTTI